MSGLCGTLHRIFIAMVHPVDPHHFVPASSMVSGCLAEAFAKNSKPKGFEDIVPTSLHTYANIFSETAFDSLPERRKWDHASKWMSNRGITILIPSA
jgi:hypothetical protein